MKFNEAIENIGTTSADVEGVPKKFSKIVRRKVPAGYIADVRKKKKKKKEEISETAFGQMDPYQMQSYMTKFWKRGNGKMEEPEKDEDEDEEEDEDEVDEDQFGQTAIVDPNFKNKAIEPFWRKGKSYKKKEDDEDESEEDDEDAE